MSHHYSAFDGRGFPDGDARLDLTDLYAFPKPGDAGRSILIMNVHPSVGENPPGPTTTSGGCSTWRVWPRGETGHRQTISRPRTSR
jgi:hypothetical protein